MSRYYDSKRDKSLMVQRNNEKIRMRESDEADLNNNRYKNRLDVDRIMLERQMTSHNFDGSSEVIGEVTGEKFTGSDFYDKGMPLRSSFTIRKSKYDNNSHLDFDLYDKIEKTNLKNVSSNDTFTGEYAGINESMKMITRGIDPYEICVSDINSTTCWMHSNMFMFMNGDYIVNGFGLFSIFGIIYLISKGNTELELKNYFGFQDKKHLNAGLLTIREKLNDFRDQIVIDNYIISDHNIPYMQSTAKKLKNLIFHIIINRSYPDEECVRVNNIIGTVSGISNTLSSSTLSKSDISLISVARLSPIWLYSIDNIVKARFRNASNQVIDFIRFVGKTFDYFEDTEIQLIEVPTKDEIFSIGIILPKQNVDSPTKLKMLSTAINYIKPTVLDEVLVPIIEKRYKTRFNKTLQKTGMNVAFTEQEMIGLFPEGGSINDCIQYVDIKFGTASYKKRCSNKGYRTTRKFIANRSFEFYLRNTENNCILIMGRL